MPTPRKLRERAELIADRLPREYIRSLKEQKIYREVIDHLAEESLSHPGAYPINVEFLYSYLQESIRKAIAYRNADPADQLKYREKQIELIKTDPKTALENEIYLDVGEALLGSDPETAEKVLCHFTSPYHPYETEGIHPAVMEYVKDAIGQIIRGTEPMKALGLQKAKGRPEISDQNKFIVELKSYMKVRKKMASGFNLKEAVAQVATETNSSPSTIKRHYLNNTDFNKLRPIPSHRSNK